MALFYEIASIITSSVKVGSLIEAKSFVERVPFARPSKPVGRNVEYIHKPHYRARPSAIKLGKSEINWH